LRILLERSHSGITPIRLPDPAGTQLAPAVPEIHDFKCLLCVISFASAARVSCAWSVKRSKRSIR